MDDQLFICCFSRKEKKKKKKKEKKKKTNPASCYLEMTLSRRPVLNENRGDICLSIVKWGERVSEH